MPILVPAAAAALMAAPAQAQDRSITDREPGVMDVARTPMTDLNLSRTEVPALLAEAEQRPYSLQGLDTCEQLTRAVGEFDAVLGPDLDLPQAERARLSGGRIAQWAVGRFIPFRGLIREISGANRQQRAVEAAIQAGLMRRAFLKGVGAARRCPYPASPATETIVAQHQAAVEKEQSRNTPGAPPARIEPDDTVSTAEPPRAALAPGASRTTARPPTTVFTSTPVVQPTR
jgi:hypothetical protein